MTIAEQIAEIKYNSDVLYEKGFTNGEAKGTYYGALAEYDRFWDAFQTNHLSNTERKNYEYAFAGQGWNSDILKPKYKIQPTTATGMFLNCQYEGDLRDFPVELNFSECTAFGNLCAYAYGITGVGVIDARLANANNGITSMFNNCTSLVTIEKLILKNDGSQTYGTNPFNKCEKLENIEIEGAFGQNINFQHSTKLSKASIVSIIKALYSGASGKTLTLSETAVNAIDWSGTVIDGVTYNTFEEVTDIKSNWTITTV